MKVNTLSDTIAYLNHTVESVLHFGVFKSLMSATIVLYAFLFDVGTSETLLALFALIIIDFVTGITASKISGQPILSSKIKHSAIKIVAYYGAIAGAHLAESGLHTYIAFVDEVVIAFFLLTELISLLENVGKMGYSTPQKLLNQLGGLQKDL